MVWTNYDSPPLQIISIKLLDALIQKLSIPFMFWIGWFEIGPLHVGFDHSNLNLVQKSTYYRESDPEIKIIIECVQLKIIVLF